MLHLSCHSNSAQWEEERERRIAAAGSDAWRPKTDPDNWGLGEATIFVKADCFTVA